MRNKLGFTLIELLIVIVVIGVIVGIVATSLNPVDKINAANDSINMHNVATVGTALLTYSSISNSGKYPNPSTTENTLVSSGDLKTFPKNQSNPSFSCASTEGQGATLINGYCYNSSLAGAAQQTAVVYVPLTSTKYSNLCSSGSFAWFVYSALINQTGVFCTSGPTQEPPLVITEFTNTLSPPTSTPTASPPIIIPPPVASPSPTPSPSWPPVQTGEYNLTAPDGRQYYIYIPNNYTTPPPGGWPLLMFVHGYGVIAASSNVTGVLLEELPNMLRTNGSFPFIVLSPRLYSADVPGGWLSQSAGNSLNSLLTQAQSGYNINAKKTYMTGYSMGGGATWNVGLRFYSKFAAIAPVAGFYQSYTTPTIPANICDLANTPVRAYHGTADATVNISIAQSLINAVTACGNSNSQLVTFNGVNHDTIDNVVYLDSSSAIYNWLLSHTLP